MPGIDYTISAHNESFVHGVHGASEALKEMHAKVKESIIHFLEFVGVALTIKENLKLLGEAMKLGGELEMLSMRTGATVSELALLQIAFKNAGMSAEQVGPTINRMQKAMTGVNEEGQSTSQAFSFLHLQMEDLKKLSTVEQFQAISEAIQKIPTPAARAAAAMGIFGRSGAELLPLFLAHGGMALAAESLGGQAETLEKNAASFHKATVLLENISTKIRGLYIGVAAGIVGPLTKVLEAFNHSTAIDKWGKELGETILYFIAAFTSGTWFDAAGLSLELAFVKALNLLGDGLDAIFGGGFHIDEQPILDDMATFDRATRRAADAMRPKTEEEKHGEEPPVASAPGVPYTPAARYEGHANRLSQIGFDMGSRATQTLAEQTAKATEKTASNLDKLLARPLSAMGAAF